MSVAIAAAGTGGHVLPALAIAAALERRGTDRRQIVFLGGDRFESEAVPAAGYRFHSFELTRLRRSASLENLRIPAVVHRGAVAMEQVLRDCEARVVLGMCGYVTVTAAVAARRAGVPFVVHEQNAHPSLAARFASRRARLTLLGLPGPAQRLPRSLVVGNPLRQEIASFDREGLRVAARARYGLSEDGFVVGLLGGSQGAFVLNRIAPAIAALDGAHLLHLTGPQAAGVDSAAGRPSLPWERLPFEDRMDLFYAAVDLVVCRAGAMTVSELAATGTPAVLVPLDRVGQGANAAFLEAAGAALVVRQGALGDLPGVVASLASDPSRLAAMATAASSVAAPGAADAVADHLLEVAIA
ncbi:MAG: glycosyltransferase [Acidimicrobiia bacterium]|nr:MAG: glycosyltransferase [Acidimicrobiia bacterium]